MGTQSRFQLTVLGIAAVVMISAFIGYNIPTIGDSVNAFMQKQNKEGNESKIVSSGRNCSLVAGKIIIYEADIEKNSDIVEYLKAHKLTYGWGYIVEFASVKVLVVDVPKGEEDVWMRNIRSRFQFLSPKIAEGGYRIGQNSDWGEYPLGRIEIYGSTPEVDQYLEKKQLRKLNGVGEFAEYAVPCGEEEEWVNKINSADFKPPAKAFLGRVVTLY